jgi:hypothetical protein
MWKSSSMLMPVHKRRVSSLKMVSNHLLFLLTCFK